MAILVKGPYSRKDYINSQDNLEEQSETLRKRIERIKDNVIMITLMVCILYILGMIVYVWNTRYEYNDAMLPYIISGAILIVIIALIAHYFSVKPYNKQKEQLYEESEQLEKHYRDNMVEVPLSEYIDHICVKGDKVTFPPLDEIDERYVYDRCSYQLDDDENDERQIFRLCPDFYEYDYLRTRGCGRIPITREECRMLQAKGRRG